MGRSSRAASGTGKPSSAVGKAPDPETQKRTDPGFAERFASRGQAIAPQKTSGGGSRGKILESHQERMDYAVARRAGEPQGSGAMESTCRQYQCRFKRPGQFWSCAGDEALMCLETFWRNGRWHLLFPHSTHGDPSKN